MKLIHMTRPEYVENIKSKGLLLSEKIKIYKQQPYIKADQLVDAYTGPSRRGKEWMTREAAHYFIFEGDKAEAFKNNDVKCYFSVDSIALDRKRLFVSSVKVYEALWPLLCRGTDKDKRDMQLLCMHWWNDLFPFDFYIKNRQMINRTYCQVWRMPFVAKVLYYGDVPAELLTLGVVGEKN